MNDDTAFVVFVKLLLLSNSKGQVALSGRKLAAKLNMNHSTLYKALGRLEEETMIKQLCKHRYTIINICNWSKYQTVSKQFGKHMVNTGETHGKQTTGVSRIENKNKEREDYRGLESPAKEKLRKQMKAKNN